jgi:hypothetical protein
MSFPLAQEFFPATTVRFGFHCDIGNTPAVEISRLNSAMMVRHGRPPAAAENAKWPGEKCGISLSLRTLGGQGHQPCQKFRIIGSIVGLHHLTRLREEVTGDVLHVHLFPKGELIVGLQVFQWNGMRSYYHRQTVLFFDESLELADMRARRIANHQACRQVYGVRAVFQKLRGHVFHVASRTAATTGIADNLQLVFGGITRKPSLPLAQSAEALTTSAIAVPGTDDDPNPYCFGLYLRPGNKLYQFWHYLLIAPFEQQSAGPCRRAAGPY